MNRRIIFVRNIKAALLSAMLLTAWAATAAPVVVPGASTDVQTNLTKPAPRSVFIQPANPSEGRDPFFPSSLRPYQGAVVPGSHAVADVGVLAIQGISGPPGHRLVIINNVTFAVGDDAEVSTSQGRIHIHCLEIGENLVVVEANGQRHELRYGEKP
ncbi:MAG TPA: hypothetical protein VMJ12_10490 [Candidatus Acidoferrales bacterium]|nr:hypothetical protein [Candidatus Acidoferrales bacterium]